MYDYMDTVLMELVSYIGRSKDALHNKFHKIETNKEKLLQEEIYIAN